ncbi:MAG: FlgD immunoglobulin-like domain containing protein [Bacteroidota bacterium]
MSALTLRMACFMLALFGLAAQAQTIVRLDPLIPVAGQIARALVTFDGTNPSSVTVFARPVGTTSFQTLAATDEGSQTWSVELPFEMPPQGLDVYAQYVLDGETLTEPAQDPTGFPYRVPALSLSARPGLSLPARQYRMVTVPLHLSPFSGVPVALGSSEPLDVFGDDFGEDGDPAQWRVLRWSPGLNRYRDATEGDVDPVIRPGRGFWIITANGGSFNVERGLSTGFTLDGERSFITTESVTLQPGWNQIGSPFLFPIQWTDVVGSDRVEDPIGYQGTYSTPQATLQPWEGYFVFSSDRAPVTLRFSALAQGRTDRAAQSLAQRMQARAGDSAGVLSVRAEWGDLSDEIYLGLATASPSARPLNLRKPPPVDDGLRLVVQEAGEEWIGRFQTQDSARWTLHLTLPSPDDVTLRFNTEGDWPDGLVIEDLDQGIELSMSGDAVSVPALATVSTRRLQIRTATTRSQPARMALGTPSPNPTSGVVTVPYSLPEAGETRLEVLDLLGRSIRVLHKGSQDAGPHAVSWDGLDATGRPVAAGVYLVRLNASGQVATARVTRLR